MNSEKKVNDNIYASSRYIRMSPDKARRVLDQIRGREYKEAVMILQFMPYKACKFILRTLKSAAANAEHNNNMNRANLYIVEAYADQGPMMKRFQPRAQGRAYPIHKPTCHINIAVGINIPRTALI
uniref:ribosomal protein L22 n=1 Tax=Timspurckia oligopyrenoides TaxID=708627 RepID=UPI001FCD0E7A|nr:ribosomal protein L22 [Timspurckia oligopyrenoides]UNJ17547.1 ribosomal protein L22 [Timspurckia oligopyrenoides]